MPFFSSIFKGKEGSSKKSPIHNGMPQEAPPKPRWADAWLRKDVDPEEVQELLRICTSEMKARALDMPFLLLPFRPTSDPSAARTFIRNFFSPSDERGGPLEGERLSQELRLTEPMVICSVMKWCWSRLAGGVVTWEAYELFRIGEQDSNYARDAFATFIPLSAASDARTKIIFDFFDLLAAIAAHGKNNGMGGRKLARLAGWWAFEHVDTGNGFDGGYKSWSSAADATSHLFFAYLRSLSPDSIQGTNGISTLPLSLQNLLQATEYPPHRPAFMQTPTTRVAMIVDVVSPTPFSLLRRAKHFEYREDDEALQQFSEYGDPIQALTDECRRVLKSISSANDSSISNSKASTGLRDASWSRFEDIGFSGLGDDSDPDDEVDGPTFNKKRAGPPGLRTTPMSKTDLGRPTTPSWADFLSSGFVDENNKQGPAPLLLPPDKILPPINMRGKSSQSHRRMTDNDSVLEPGELASITSFELDDAFWWVWITSLAGEETTERKACFGRCALIETNIKGGKWLVMEEMVKGAAPEPETGAYIAEKKNRFGFSKRSKISRSKSSYKKGPTPKVEPYQNSLAKTPMSKTNIAPDQHARIQAAAAALQKKQQLQEAEAASPRRARHQENGSVKTNSVFTLQPVIMSEAAPAMKWANSYDKDAIRAAYLGSDFAGKGAAIEMLGPNPQYNPMLSANGSTTHVPSTKPSQPEVLRNESNEVIRPKPDTRKDSARTGSGHDHDLPALPKDGSLAVDLASKMEQKPTTVSTPPLVPPKTIDVGTANKVSTETAGVSLPVSTSLDSSRTIERKAVPLVPMEQPKSVSGTEAFFSGPEYSEHTVPEPELKVDSSPESKKSLQKKLKKKDQTGGGFKGLFGRKKGITEVKPVPEVKTSPAAVAAARAAIQKPSQPEEASNKLLPPTQSKVSRRLSNLGKKPGPDSNPIVIPPTTVPDHELQKEPPAPSADPTPIPSPRYPPQDRYMESTTSISRVDTSEQPLANREFRKFDQGPLEDQPAFVPEDSLVRPISSVTEPVEDDEEHAATLPAKKDIPEDPAQSMIPVQDRWAQIRKNAAERAAKQSEEQSKGTDKTDDGETSGEEPETIESRVARIKARVAELTGNMDPASVNPGRR
ncbi:MAG: hypothetical protein MMC33_002442 [Icmadophila ericetorum]|nr:hypothetical protein [Icmadophila ericetorum]